MIGIVGCHGSEIQLWLLDHFPISYIHELFLKVNTLYGLMDCFYLSNQNAFNLLYKASPLIIIRAVHEVG